jgi:SAM-dependent methyltransferase
LVIVLNGYRGLTKTRYFNTTNKKIKVNALKNNFQQNAETWDAHYQSFNDITGYEVIRRRQITIERLSALIKRDDALVVDLGCGTGRVLSGMIKARSTWQGIGLDISDEMVASCRKKYSDEPNLRFIQHDISTGPAPFKADALLALGVLGYLIDIPLVLNSIRKMLIQGGFFIFSINKPSLPRSFTATYRRLRFWWSWHEQVFNNRSYSLTQTKQFLANQFKILETYDYCYLPYVPLLRRFVPLSQLLEKGLGGTPTPLSSTTLFITQNQEYDHR